MGVTVLLAPAAALVWVALRVILVPPLLARPIRFWDEVVPAVGVATGVLLIASFFGFLAYLVLESARNAWWLAGTRLGHRRTLRTAWVDLSTADVGTSGPGEQSLVARAASGVTVTLPVRRYGETLLAADHLIAIAEAITRDRPPAGPHDPAYLLAERLRRLAVEPATVVHRADTAAATPAGHRRRPVLLLAVAVLFLGLSISYGRIAVQEAQVRLDYGAGQECRSSTDAGGCWTRSTATVVEVDVCSLSRRVCPVGTTYDLRLADGRTVKVELRHTVEDGPAEGDTMEVRVFRDRVVSVHGGERWFDTLAHPRVALAESLSFAGVLTGICLGALIGAASAVGVRRDRGRRPDRDPSRPRRRWGWIGGVVVVAPLPAFLFSVWYSGPPVWTLVLLTAGTAAIGVVVQFRQRVAVHFRRRFGKAGPAPRPAAEAPSPAGERERATDGGATGDAEPDRASADVTGAGDDELGGGQLR